MPNPKKLTKPAKPSMQFDDPDGESIPTKAQAAKSLQPPQKPIKKDPDTLGMKRAKGGKCYAKGGGVFRSSANGIAKKGKTKAMMPKMACGGMAKGGKKGRK